MIAETRGDISAALIAHAWTRIRLTVDISRDELNASVESAKSVGFLRDAPDLSRLIGVP